MFSLRYSVSSLGRPAQLTSISHEGVFYELVGEKKGSKPRPFIYMLRKKPQTAVIRGIYAYDPDEVLQAKK